MLQNFLNAYTEKLQIAQEGHDSETEEMLTIQDLKYHKFKKKEGIHIDHTIFRDIADLEQKKAAAVAQQSSLSTLQTDEHQTVNVVQKKEKSVTEKMLEYDRNRFAKNGGATTMVKAYKEKKLTRE